MPEQVESPTAVGPETIAEPAGASAGGASGFPAASRAGGAAMAGSASGVTICERERCYDAFGVCGIGFR